MKIAALVQNLCFLVIASRAYAGEVAYKVNAHGQAPGITDQICFNADGVMFNGNGNDTQDVSISRLTCWGGSANAFGSALPDPDAVVVDIDGVICGVPGGILVGGHDDGGYIVGFDPCTGALIEEWAWTGLDPLDNPSDMVVNSQGLLLVCQPVVGVYQSAIGAVEPALLCQPFGDGPQRLAVNQTDEIFTSTSDGTISLYAADGQVIDQEFVTGLGFVMGLAVGSAGAWGTDLYAANQAGQLFRINAIGEATEIVSSLGSVSDIAFGPGDLLYVADADTGEIRTIRAVECASDLTGDGETGFDDLLLLLDAWGPCN